MIKIKKENGITVVTYKGVVVYKDCDHIYAYALVDRFIQLQLNDTQKEKCNARGNNISRSF